MNAATEEAGRSFASILAEINALALSARGVLSNAGIFEAEERANLAAECLDDILRITRKYGVFAVPPNGKIQKLQ